MSESDETETFEQVFDQEWEASATDTIPHVMDHMESEGLLPKVEDPGGLLCSRRSQYKQVQLRADKYKLPEIECWLDASWNFFEIEVNARRQLGHVNPDKEVSYERRLLAAALDLEDVLRAEHAEVTGADVYHFSTSLQVWVHLASFCRKTLWSPQADQQQSIESARRRFCRALGSYAHSVRNGPQRSEENHTGSNGSGSALLINIDNSTIRNSTVINNTSISLTRNAQTVDASSACCGNTHCKTV